MYLAIKDNKIIAISEKKEVIIHTEDGDIIQDITGEALFPCLEFDEVIEDTEHTVNDYTLYNNEYLLNTDEKVIELQNTEKSNQVRSIRSQYMSDTLARCDRYEKQKAIGLDTTESEDTYRNYLLYLQYLRDVPQSENFPNVEVLTFDKWKEIISSDIVLTEKETESEVIEDGL